MWLARSAFAIAANSIAYDAARWREGEATMANAYDPMTVDAGYEWVGYHARLVATPNAPAAGMTWAGDRWLLADACAVLSNSPLEDDALKLIRINQTAYQQYLFFGPDEPIYIYAAAKVGYPSVRSAFAVERAP